MLELELELELGEYIDKAIKICHIKSKQTNKQINEWMNDRIIQINNKRIKR